jgi:hypothetical protein
MRCTAVECGLLTWVGPHCLGFPRVRAIRCGQRRSGGKTWAPFRFCAHTVPFVPIRPRSGLPGLRSNGYVLLGVCLLLVGLVKSRENSCVMRFRARWQCLLSCLSLRFREGAKSIRDAGSERGSLVALVQQQTDRGAERSVEFGWVEGADQVAERSSCSAPRSRSTR